MYIVAYEWPAGDESGYTVVLTEHGFRISVTNGSVMDEKFPPILFKSRAEAEERLKQNHPPPPDLGEVTQVISLEEYELRLMEAQIGGSE